MEFPTLDTAKLTTYSLKDRKSKVNTKDFADRWSVGGSFVDFLFNLPDILAGRDLIRVIDALARAKSANKTVMMGMGAHVIKVGLSPIVTDLVRRGIVGAVALNGAGIIHDYEIAFSGKTSEEVEAGIGSGEFGMARETSEFINRAVKYAKSESMGLGEAVGRLILEEEPPYADLSIPAACVKMGAPITVHVAMGTDIVHMSSAFDAAAAGEASYRDFMTFCAVTATLEEGVYMNVGSAVILPEVFLKALTLSRNLGHTVKHLTTVNLDFVRQYRPLTNVVNRPTLEGGKGYHLTGHHEIMLPLIAAGVIEALEESS